MDRRRNQTRNFGSQGQRRTSELTTKQLRNRKAAREGSLNRPRDLRLNIEKKVSRDKTTKFVDAREKIQSNRSVEQLPEKTSLSVNDRRKESRANIIAKNRSLSLDSGSIKITAKQNVPPNRSAQFAGQSIQITAKLEPKPKATPRNRNAKIQGLEHITVTAKSPKGVKSTTPKARKPVQPQVYKRQELPEESSETMEYIPTRPRARTPLADRLDHGPEPPQHYTPQTSTRVTITNLFPSVSRQDIEELFGAVGVLKSCKILRPGAAEVVYTTKEDAVTAYARYHNRNLDGQPMQCKLSVMPSAATYTPPPAAPLPPLRPTVAAIPKYQAVQSEPYVPQMVRPTQTPSRPVVFKVKI